MEAKMHKVPTVLGIVLILSGCATQATLTINTQPVGGYVTEIGTGGVFGLSPNAVAVYDLASPNVPKNAAGCYLVKGVTVQWVSGATANTGEITLCGPSNGTYNLAVNRPSNYPNIEDDIRFSLEVESLLLQQRQAASQGFIALIQSFQTQKVQHTEERQPQQQWDSVICKSVVDGERVTTNCR